MYPHPEAELSKCGSFVEWRTPVPLTALMRTIPGSRYVPKDKIWRTSSSLPVLVQSFGILRGQTGLGPRLLEHIRQCKDLESELRGLVSNAMDPTVWGSQDVPLGTLLPFQPSAIEFGRRAGSWILGDDPGSGKTVMALQWLGDGHGLVVCPTGVQGHWLRELERWCPDKVHVALPRTASARVKALRSYRDDPDRGALVISYSQVVLHSRLAPWGGVSLSEKEKAPKELQDIPFSHLIVDEAHRAFHPKTKWTRGLWQLSQQVEHTLALSGTPLEANPLDLWSLLHLVDPEGWPSRSRFMDLYCVVHQDHWGGVTVGGIKPAMMSEFSRLLAGRLIRRRKQLTLPHLPPKVRQEIAVELTPTMRKTYNELRATMMSEGESGVLQVFDPIALHTRLVQAASATLVETGTYTDTEGVVHQEVTMAMPSPKITALLELLTDLGEAPVAVFSVSRQLLGLASVALTKAKIQHTLLVGGQTVTETLDAVDRYNSGRARVILISLGAGAEGVSLTRGSTEVFLDRSYRALTNKQAEDRMHGTGRGDTEADHLHIITLVASDTVEQRRDALLTEKAEMFLSVLGEEDAE